MKTQIIEHMINKDYHANEAISKSDIDMLYSDSAYMEWKKSSPKIEESTKECNFGSAFHSYVLENEVFEEHFIVLPKIDRRTKKGKSDYEKFIGNSSGKIVITQEEFDLIYKMGSSLNLHPTFASIMELASDIENSYFYYDKKNNIYLKCRPDIIYNNNGKTVLVDLKTISSLSDIYKNIHTYNYFVQASYYMTVYSKVMKELYDESPKLDFMFVFISKTQKSGRYPVSFVKLSNDYISAGNDFIKVAIKNYIDYTLDKKTFVSVIQRPSWV